jgi:hypothetical protein
MVLITVDSFPGTGPRRGVRRRCFRDAIPPLSLATVWAVPDASRSDFKSPERRALPIATVNAQLATAERPGSGDERGSLRVVAVTRRADGGVRACIGRDGGMRCVAAQPPRAWPRREAAVGDKGGRSGEPRATGRSGEPRPPSHARRATSADLASLAPQAVPRGAADWRLHRARLELYDPEAAPTSSWSGGLPIS